MSYPLRPSAANERFHMLGSRLMRAAAVAAVALVPLGLLATASPASAAPAPKTATVSVLHGIPGLTVDVYANDTLLINDFTPGSLKTVKVPGGTYNLELFPATSTDSSGTPILAASATVANGKNYTVTANLSATGTPALNVFVNNQAAIKKGKMVELGAEMSRSQVLGAVADKSYEILFEGMYNRGDELDADEKGIVLANKAGYDPAGLAAFLTRLMERNKDQAERNGLFASHPETKERIEKLTKQVASAKLLSVAKVAGRYKAAITYKPVAVTEISQVTAGASGLAGGSSKDAKATDSKSGGSKLGLGKLSALGGEKKSASTVASAGARGGVPDRDAKGGSNSAIVRVAVTASEIAEFKKGIVG